jgi:hypothetical protein
VADPEVSDRLADLVLLALHHGVRSVQHGGPLIPFVLTEIGRERLIHRFVEEGQGGLSLKAGVSRARHWAEALGDMVDAYVVTYRGRFRAGGGEGPAIIAEGREPREGSRAVYAQPFRPKRLFRRAVATGNPIRVPQG